MVILINPNQLKTDPNIILILKNIIYYLINTLIITIIIKIILLIIKKTGILHIVTEPNKLMASFDYLLVFVISLSFRHHFSIFQIDNHKNCKMLCCIVILGEGKGK